MYELQFTQFIAHPRSEVFAFFSELSNLERITPPWLHFKILNPLPCTIKTGSLVNYRLKILGISFRGQTEIEQFEPDDFFTDIQRRGPYRHWHHLHRFVEVEGGTLIEDHVQYRLRGGPLGWLMNRLFAQRSLKRVFAFRKQTIESLLLKGAPSSSGEDNPA